MIAINWQAFDWGASTCSAILVATFGRRFVRKCVVPILIFNAPSPSNRDIATMHLFGTRNIDNPQSILVDSRAERDVWKGKRCAKCRN
jgi:hypothetical protein